MADPTPKPPDPTGTLHLYLSTLQIHGDEPTLSGVYDAWDAFQKAVTDSGHGAGGTARLVVDPTPVPELTDASSTSSTPPADPFKALADRISPPPAIPAATSSSGSAGLSGTGSTTGV